MKTGVARLMTKRRSADQLMLTDLKMVLQVVPGKKIMLLARRDGAKIRFSLRAGAGSPVARAPWKEEWGGGASVENPYFQRVHYCELLASLATSVSHMAVTAFMQHLKLVLWL